MTFTRPISVGVILLASAILLTGCGSAHSQSSGTRQTPDVVPSAPATTSRLLPPTQFAAAMAEPDRVTINVHVPFAGEISTTDRMVPYDQIGEKTNALPTDLNTPLAIYCRTGRMSAIAGQTLTGLGYTDVVELEGGMDAWVTSGRPLLTTPPE